MLSIVFSIALAWFLSSALRLIARSRVVKQLNEDLKVLAQWSLDARLAEPYLMPAAPLADQPRRKADVLYKAYLTPDMDAQVRAQAEREHIDKSALIRKALAAYLTANQAQPAIA